MSPCQQLLVDSSFCMHSLFEFIDNSAEYICRIEEESILLLTLPLGIERPRWTPRQIVRSRPVQKIIRSYCCRSALSATPALSIADCPQRPQRLLPWQTTIPTTTDDSWFHASSSYSCIFVGRHLAHHGFEIAIRIGLYASSTTFQPIASANEKIGCFRSP